MEKNGFNRNYLTENNKPQRSMRTAGLAYRDVVLLHPKQQNRDGWMRPLVLDLGRVAKGFAMDLAAEELLDYFQNFVIDAGGDIPSARPPLLEHAVAY